MKGKRNLTVALLLGLLFLTAITVLPLACPSFAENSYTVIDGDCLSIIAEKLATSVDSLKSANNLDSDDLQIGQQLVIPGGASYYGYTVTDSYYSGDAYSYTVIDGDCLSVVAEKLGTSVDAIRSANNLDSDDLQIGQQLVIPGSETYYSCADTDYSYTGSTDDAYSYTVAQGDCLSLIADKFGASADSIRSANNLDSDDLQVGQTLLVAGNFSSEQPISRGDVNRSAQTSDNSYGELVDWSRINNMFPMGNTATLQDFETGRTFKIHHLFGENHADCEPLTAYDSSIMKQCFGGDWSWERRAAIIWLDGTPIACSMAGMPHGTSQDIYDNDFDGHFDLHFLNSRTHGTDSIDPDHQAMVRRAAGL